MIKKMDWLNRYVIVHFVDGSKIKLKPARLTDEQIKEIIETRFWQCGDDIMCIDNIIRIEKVGYPKH